MWLKLLFVSFICISIVGCTPYIPKNPIVSQITKAKQIEFTGGLSFYYLYAGGYGQFGYGLSNKFSTHISGDYTLTGIQFDHKYRFYTPLGEKIRMSTSLGGAWGYSDPIKSIGYRRDWIGQYYSVYNQSNVTFLDKRAFLTLGTKAGVIDPNFIITEKDGEEDLPSITHYKELNVIIEPYILVSYDMGKNLYAQGSYSNAWLSETNDFGKMSNMRWDIAGNASVGITALF